ncbi:hypothetical protein XarbCFBP8132_00385 [Xanthomonas arboricola]|nr:hypothetical protein XarbCFBP8132_00385 [Xanthomonas arboricola]
MELIMSSASFKGVVFTQNLGRDLTLDNNVTDLIGSGSHWHDRPPQIWKSGESFNASSYATTGGLTMIVGYVADDGTTITINSIITYMTEEENYIQVYLGGPSGSNIGYEASIDPHNENGISGTVNLYQLNT